MGEWYYNDAGEQRGPVAEEQIVSLLKSGNIQTSTLLWTEGMADWQPVGNMTRFQPAVTRIDNSPYAAPRSEASAANWDGYDPSGPQVRPWVRYWARTFDFLFFGMIITVLLMIFSPQQHGKMNETFLVFILRLIYNFVEPAMLATLGTTPYKALLRVRVRNHDDSKPSYFRGLHRILKLWLRGQALGIPFVALVTSINSYSRLHTNGVTSWDEDLAFKVTHREITWWRWLLLIASAAAYICLVIIGLMV